MECFVDLPEEGRIGWQAKYVFSIDSLLRQASDSLTTALRVHATLSRYVLCFPFDLTGPTARPGRSEFEKLEDWRAKQLEHVEGRELEIEIWSATKLRALLLDLDPSGGMRSYFFDKTAFSNEWFKTRLGEARTKAGPRYTPELNVRTGVAKWFEAFGRTPDWIRDLAHRTQEVREIFDNLRAAIMRTSQDSWFPAWPGEFHEDALKVCTKLDEVAPMITALARVEAKASYQDTVRLLQEGLAGLTELDKGMSVAFESKHGAGTADSPGFRQFMTEYHATFPASNLDEVRKARKAVQDLLDWLRSPEGHLGFRKAFVLSGGWGVGKTHSTCDVGHLRERHELLTCIVFGHEFGGQPDPWSRIAESLGLPSTLGRDALLRALECAGETSGRPLLVIVDAINETDPRQYWSNHIRPLVQEIRKRARLRVCITCRTSFLSQCLPDGHGLDVVEHPGFKGIERIACQEFFKHYKLQPPVAPILQPELSNPLYLKLVCETLAARGEKRLPLGWASMAKVVEAFLHQKDKEFAKQKGISIGVRLITRSLHELARTMAGSAQSNIGWSRAAEVVNEVYVRATNLGVIEWLTGEGLLIESGPEPGSEYENTLRLSFERLGDFLLAGRLLKQVEGESLAAAFDPGGHLHELIRDRGQIDQNRGVLSALSILIPERETGIELPQLIGPRSVRDTLSEITLANLPSRDPSTFSDATGDLVREGLATARLSRMSMDSVVSMAWQQSVLDARWLHKLLIGRALARRDAWWCGYLHRSYEVSGPVRRLIEAVFDLPVDELDPAVGERWAMVLAWFTAAADRRVKDRATRALLRVLIVHPAHMPRLLSVFLAIDDDAVRERFLLASYGALLALRDRKVIAGVIEVAHQVFAADPRRFDNALIRDHIRLLAELADHIKALPEDSDPGLSMRPIPSEWPLEIPTDEEVESWGEVIRFRPNEFLSDFFKYSMHCLNPWQETLSKEEMGKWIVQRIARDFGYKGSGCETYDEYVLATYGGGRGKPKWAERIGKKYQWMAMYQLASRLNDHLEREQDAWEAPPLRTPLILLKKRELDPTLPHSVFAGENTTGSRWIGGSMDLGDADSLGHDQWIARAKDLPSLENLLALAENSGQTWRPLVLHHSWSGKKTKNDERRPYRYAWIAVRCYLVSERDLSSAYELLRGRNFSGNWMPAAADLPYGFPGEYPWATPFNTEPDEWHGGGGTDALILYQPCWNRLIAEWEYDASLPDSFSVTVPAREFFSFGDLWWDGQDGYRVFDGRTVFRDPSVTEGGAATLIADAQDLAHRLKAMERCLIWTMWGEKIILGGSIDRSHPLRTFSQVAHMRKDGSVEVSDRVFFEDYGQAVGFPTTE